MERKEIPRQSGGRRFDETSPSARAVRLVRDEGLSQAAAAKACGITQSAVSRAIAARERRDFDDQTKAVA